MYYIPKSLISVAFLLCSFPLYTYSQESQSVDSLTIQIPTYTDLEEIVVKANSPLLKTDGNKLEYNVEEDPAASASSVLDILRKTPLVTVDGQDNISVNGSSNFKLLINGKEEPMISQNASLILKNAPASMVSRIEVITDPGAKYDAEGVGGILNLVTDRKHQSEDGYNGQLSLSFGRANNNISAYCTMKKNKFTMSANVTYADGHIFPQTQEKTADYTYRNNRPVAFMQVRENNRFSYGFVYGMLNASWEPNASNLFTWSASINYIDGNIDDYNSFSRSFNNNGKLLYGWDQKFEGGLGNNNISANVSYQHNFSEQNNYLTLSYLFSYGRNRMHILTGYEETYEFMPLGKYLDNDNINYTREHTVQGDYVNGFGTDKHLMETGVKGIFRRNSGLGFQTQGNEKDALKAVEGGVMHNSPWMA